MTDDAPPAPKHDFATELRRHMTQDDFPSLLKRFDESACTATTHSEAYAVATWMFTRFPRESQALLPLVKSKQLGFDGSNAPTATTSEWAAALTAAKLLSQNLHGHAFETVTEAQLDDSAKQIYSANNPGKAMAIPRK